MKTSSAIDFVPFIEHSSRHKGYWVTAPRADRIKIWDALTDLQHNILSIDGGEPTEILVKANPGYDPKEALYALTVATYVALMTDLDSIFGLGSYKKHVENIRSSIQFVGLDAPNEENVRFWIDTWFVKKASAQLDGVLRDIKEFNLGYIDERINAIKARRNKISRDLSWFKQPVLKANWLNQCDNAMAEIAKVRAIAVFANTHIAPGQKAALLKVAEFKALMQTSEIASLGDRFDFVMSELESLRDVAEEWFETVDHKYVNELKNQILLLNA